jgi:hypothetical protein
MRSMKRAVLDRGELEYEIRGSGEPIVLVHDGAGVVSTFRPRTLCEHMSHSGIDVLGNRQRG